MLAKFQQELCIPTQIMNVAQIDFISASLPVPSKLVNFLQSQLTADFLSSKLHFLQAIVGNAPFGHVELFFEWWHRNWHLPHHEDVPIQSWNGQALDEEFQFLAGSETTSNDINAGNGS